MPAVQRVFLHTNEQTGFMELSKNAELPQWFIDHIKQIARQEESLLQSNRMLLESRNALQLERCKREVAMYWPFVPDAASNEHFLAGLLPLAWDDPDLAAGASLEAAFQHGASLMPAMASFPHLKH